MLVVICQVFLPTRSEVYPIHENASLAAYGGIVISDEEAWGLDQSSGGKERPIGPVVFPKSRKADE